MDECQPSVSVSNGPRNTPESMIPSNNVLACSSASYFEKLPLGEAVCGTMDSNGLSGTSVLAEQSHSLGANEVLEDLNVETRADLVSIGIADVVEQQGQGDTAFVRDAALATPTLEVVGKNEEPSSQGEDTPRSDNMVMCTDWLEPGNTGSEQLLNPENELMPPEHGQQVLQFVGDFDTHKGEEWEEVIELTVDSKDGSLQLSQASGAEKQGIEDLVKDSSCKLVGNRDCTMEIDMEAPDECLTNNAGVESKTPGSSAADQIQFEGVQCTGLVKETSDVGKVAGISPQLLGLSNVLDRQLDIQGLVEEPKGYEVSISTASKEEEYVDNDPLAVAINVKDFEQLAESGLPGVSAQAGGSGDAQHSECTNGGDLLREESVISHTCVDSVEKDLKQEPLAIQASESDFLQCNNAEKVSIGAIPCQQAGGLLNTLGTVLEVGSERKLEPETFQDKQEMEGANCPFTSDFVLDGQAAYASDATGNLELMWDDVGGKVMDIDGETLSRIDDEEIFVGSVKNGALVEHNSEITHKSLSNVIQSPAGLDQSGGVAVKGSKHNNGEDLSFSPQRNGMVVEDESATIELKRRFLVTDTQSSAATSHSEDWSAERNLQDGYISEEPGEGHIPKESLNGENEQCFFSIGDLVWAKVKSHPWWPGQIFDSGDASHYAKKVQKPGRILVAFFGDRTFGWLQQSQLLAFHPHFSEKVKQTNMKSFCNAVAEALDEVCRRVELGLRCSCHRGEFYNEGTFPDENTGIQAGVRINVHRDISTSREIFKPEKTLEFIRGVACSPLGSWNYSLQGAESLGQVYAFRTAAFGTKSSFLHKSRKDVEQVQGAETEFLAQLLGKNLKRKLSAVEGESRVVTEKGIGVKKVNVNIDGFSSREGIATEKSSSDIGDQLLPSASSIQKDKLEMAGVLGIMARENAGVHVLEDTIKDAGFGKSKRVSALQGPEDRKKVKRFHLQMHADMDESMQGKGLDGAHSSDDDSKTLFALAGHNSKLLKIWKKGNLHQGDDKHVVKTVAEVDAGKRKEEKKIEKQCVSMSKGALETDKVVDQRPAGDGEVKKESTFASSNCRTKDLVLTCQTRTPEQRTKFLNDANAATSKEVMLDSFDIITTSKTLKEKSFGDNLTLKELKETLCVKNSPISSSDLKITKDEVRYTKKQLRSPNLQDGHEIAKQNLSSSHVQQSEDLKKTLKPLKLGECLQRFASDLTGIPPITKCLDQTSAKKAFSDVGRKSVLKKEKMVTAGEIGPPKLIHIESNSDKAGLGFLPLLQELLALARNPLNVESRKKPSEVRNAFLKFRDMVFQKSAGYGAPAPEATGKVVGKADAHLKMMDRGVKMTKFQRLLEDDALTEEQGQSVKIASQAHKRKLEVIQELAKNSKRRATLVSPTSSSSQLHSSGTGNSMRKHAEKRQNDKLSKHYSQRPTSPPSDNKSPTQHCNSLQAPVALFMKFPQGFALPSEAQLKATFIRFGQLHTSGTRVYRDTGSAQVVFKHGTDAEVALKYAKENSVFGQAPVSFRLRPFSYPQRVDIKGNVNPSGKEGTSVKVGHQLSLFKVEKPQALEESFRSKDQLSALNSVASNKMDISTIHHSESIPSPHFLQAFENPLPSNAALNLNSVPSKPELGTSGSSGDIKDQMIKLLRQVSVIVGSSGLAAEPS